MLTGNQFANALVNAGMADPLKKKRTHYKKFTCRKCGEPMMHIPDSNIMVCTKCKNYYLFDKVK